MPKRGENIYKRKDNRWEGRYVREYDSSGKARFGYVYARSYREVKQKLFYARTAHAQQEVNACPKQFGDYCDEWLLLSRSRVKESTYNKYYSVVQKYLKPAFQSDPLSKLNTVEIEAFSSCLLTDRHLAPKTVHDILTVLKAILKYMQKQEAVFQDIEIICPREPKKEIRVLTPEEQTRFVRYLLTDMDSVKFGILLAFFTGLRIGELCALRWNDIDLDHKAMSITLTMQRLQMTEGTPDTKTRVIISDAKSAASRRVIPLTEYVVSLCRCMQAADPCAYVLTGDDTKYMEPRTLQYRLKKYTKDCGLSDVHFHTLRHTFATRCVEVGFEIKSLSEILGHSSVKITLDRYVHPSMQVKRENMEKLERIAI